MTDVEFGALLAVLGRIADALERQLEADDEQLTYPLSEYAMFDWAAIGAKVVQRDQDGVSVVRLANGRLAKRRSNDKFGTEIWFSYANSRTDDGTPRYVKVVEFRDVLPPEPLGRKTERAMKQATAIPTALEMHIAYLKATKVNADTADELRARVKALAQAHNIDLATAKSLHETVQIVLRALEKGSEKHGE